MRIAPLGRPYVSLGPPVQVGYDKAKQPSHFEHTMGIAQRDRQFIARHMLQHVTAVDPAHACIGDRQSANDVAEPYIGRK